MSPADWLADYARSHPNRIAVIDAGSRRQHAFRGFDNRANQIAHFCEQWVGLQPGDCIGLLSSPSDDVLQIVIAAGKLDLTALLLDPANSSDNLTANINEYGPRTVFYGLAQANLVQEIWFEVDSVEHFLPLRGAVDTANFEDIVAHYPPTPPSVEFEDKVPWVHFAAQGITWSGLEAVITDDVLEDGLGTVPAPLFDPSGLAAAIAALRTGRCVIVREDSVEVIESPAEIDPSQYYNESASQRNVPTGRSWLPHEFL